MNFRRWAPLAGTSLLILLPMLHPRLNAFAILGQDGTDQPKPSDVQRVTVEDLKAKLTRNEPVTIIDVRASDAYAGSESKIKGAIFVRYRRLQSRLGAPPLKDLPRDREVITYCACPNEETSIRAAEAFLAAGFQRVRALKGGWQEWLKAGGQIEQKSKGI